MFFAACTVANDPGYPIEVSGGGGGGGPDAQDVALSCHNGEIISPSPSETLVLQFGCGTQTLTENSALFVLRGSGSDQTSLTETFACGNNVLSFTTDETLMVHEIVAQTFDVTCD